MKRCIRRSVARFIKAYLGLNLFVLLYAIVNGYVNLVSLEHIVRVFKFSIFLLQLMLPLLGVFLIMEFLSISRKRNKHVLVKKTIL